MRSIRCLAFLVAGATAVILPSCASSDNGGGADDDGRGGSGGKGGKGGSGGKGGAGGKASAGGAAGMSEETGGASGSAAGGSGAGGSGAGGSASGGSGAGGSASGGSGAGGSASGGTGAGGSATGGTGAGGAGTGGSGAGGASPPACLMGRKAATGAIIDNFDGMKQTLEWRVADAVNKNGTVVMPTGSLKVTVTGADTHAVGALACWAMKDRPCMDASAYEGIQFTVTGNVGNLFLRVSTPATLPLDDGGTCSNVATMCAYAHYQKDVTAGLMGGAPVKVPFADLRPAYGTPAAFDKSALVALVFLTRDPMTIHSFTIDNIAFY